ncbi:MAG: hypothetical protein JWN52_2282, partial [Actinomycetia bacterium]|nr:hypothetical protein [Actinomycetes bacterium]
LAVVALLEVAGFVCLEPPDGPQPVTASATSADAAATNPHLSIFRLECMGRIQPW